MLIRDKHVYSRQECIDNMKGKLEGTLSNMERNPEFASEYHKGMKHALEWSLTLLEHKRKEDD